MTNLWVLTRRKDAISRRLSVMLLACVLAVFLTSCGGGSTGGGGTPSSVTLTSIGVSPSTPAVAKGATQQFTATGTFSDGTSGDVTNQVSWDSSSTGVATVGNTTPGCGLACGVGVGQSAVHASLGGVSGSAVLTVTGATLKSIQVAPGTPSIARGTTQPFTATGVFSDATTQDLTSSVTWTSSNTGAATISNTAASNGLATGVGAGRSTVTATFGGVSSTATLNVTTATLSSVQVSPGSPAIAKGTTQAFTARGTFSDSTTQDLTTQVNWTSSSTGVATISNTAPNQGLASSVAAGQSTVTATLSGVSGTTVLTVSAATLSSIQVAPGTPSIARGTTQQFIATGTFSDLTTQNLTSLVTWNSSNTAAATISNTAGSNGLATGVGAGQSSTITALFNGVSGTTTLSVTAATLASIQVSPNSPAIAKGTTQAFTARGTFSDSTTQDLTTQVNWTSSSTGVATISNTAPNQGLASSVAVGQSTVTATLSGVSGTTVLTVGAATLQALAVPSTALKAPGTRLRLRCVGTFSDGSTEDMTSQATWSTSSSAVASISNLPGSQGLVLVNGSAGQTATLTATRAGLTATSTLTVGQFAYAISTQVNTISAFAINGSTGALTAAPGSPFATGTYPISVTVDPTGRFAYTANENGKNVSAYTISGTTGALTAVAGSPFAAGNRPMSVTVDPTGRFAYVTDFTDNSVYAYAIDGITGALTAVAGSPFAAGFQAMSVAVDPTGRFAYVANFTNNVSAFTIDGTTGALTAVAGSPFAAGSGPISVTVDPTGRIAYVANVFGDSVSAYTIDGNTGALTAVAGSPFAVGHSAHWVAVDPTGRFAYVPNGTNATVSAFAVNGATGALTAVSGSPFAAGGNYVNAVAVDPTGRFLYTGNCTAPSTVSCLAIDGTTGALTAPTTVSVGQYPNAVTTTP